MPPIIPAILVGWATGAAINYLADVLPLRRRLAAPFCLACDAPMPWANYLFWPRRCASCGKRRSLRTWLVEIFSIVAAAWLFTSAPATVPLYFSLLLLLFFGVVTVVDMEYRLILHPVSIAGAALGLVVGAWLHGVWPTLLGGAAGFGAMFLLYYGGALFMRLLARLRGETVAEDALGFGDVNLSGVLGLLLGWPGIVAGLVLAILLGGVVSLVYLLAMLVTRRYRSFMAIPYGPFLVASAIILLYFKDILFR